MKSEGADEVFGVTGPTFTPSVFPLSLPGTRYAACLHDMFASQDFNHFFSILFVSSVLACEAMHVHSVAIPFNEADKKSGKYYFCRD